MSTPDVRVRLSPEGIKEVIAALRLLQQESDRARKNAGSGLSTFNNALRELKSLLPAIGLAALVGGFAALTRQALQTADATGKLQQKVGGAVEDISALTLAFRTNQSNQEDLQQTLLKTASFQADVAAGNEKAIETIRRLGIEAKAFSNLNTPRALEEIAKKLAAIPNEGQRAAVAADIFGEKVSGKLLVALKAVGTQGIDPFIKKAKELGVLIDEDLANAAARANDALDTIRIQAEGLATQFAAGLAPAVAQAMEEFSRAVTGDGTNGMRVFGQVVGGIIKGVVLLFIGLGKTIGATVAKIVSFVNAIVEASKAIAHGDFKAAGAAFEQSARERFEIEQNLQQDIRDSANRLFGEQAATPAAAAGGGGILPSVDEQARKTQQARAAFIRQSLQDELKLQQEGIKNAEDAVKRGYERGVLSLADYFDKRKALIQENTQAEIAALRLERQAVLDAATGDNAPKNEAERLKLKQDIARLDQQMRVAELQGSRELASLEQERFQAAKELRQDQLELEGKLAELEGDRHKAFQINLDEEIQRVIELGKRAGQTAEEIGATVDRLTNARTNQFNFEDATKRGQAALEAFNRDAEQIRRDQQAGIISQVEGELRLIDLEKQRLEVLQQLAQQLLVAAEATGSEEQIAKAKEYAASIDEIAKSYQGATNAGAQLKTGAINALQNGFQTLLANADKIKSVGDAFKQLARTVVQALQQIVAEIIAKQAILALVRAFGAAYGGGGAGGGLAGAGTMGGVGIPAKTGGRVRGYVAGGDIKGPGLNIPGADTVPILAQKGEFMMRRARVQEPGALSFLRNWNAGAFRLADLARVPRFATGGQIGAPTGSPPPATAEGGNGLRIINLLDPNLVADGINSASGARSVLNVISRNSVSVRRMLGVR